MVLRHPSLGSSPHHGLLTSYLCQQQQQQQQQRQQHFLASASFSSSSLPLSSTLSSVYPTIRLIFFSLLLFSSCCVVTQGFTVKAESLSSYSSGGPQGLQSASSGPMDSLRNLNDVRTTLYEAYKRRLAFRHPLILPCTKHEMLYYCTDYGGDLCYRKRHVIPPLCRCRKCYSGSRCEIEDIVCVMAL